MSLVPTGHRCKKKADKPAWFMDISHVLLFCSSRDHLAFVGMQHSARVSGCKKGFSKGATRLDVTYHARLDIVFGHLS